MSRVLGADWAKRRWAVVALDDGTFAGAWTVGSIADVLDDPALVIGVDTPLGESSPRGRGAEPAARAALPGRAATLFNPPPLAALACDSYADANAVTRRIAGKGLARQSWGLRDAMRDARGPWCADPVRLREVHPESSFCAMRGAVLRSRKTTSEGQLERARLLAEHGIALELAACAGLPIIDVLDAAAAAWTAHRVARGEARSLPDPPERDPEGRPVAIWC